VIARLELPVLKKETYINIGIPKLVTNDHQISYQVDVTSAQGNKTLWYSLDESFADLLCNKADAALLGLLAPAMLAGEDIHIEGAVSEQLFYNLSGPIQKILKLTFPILNRIKIVADNICYDQPKRAKGVITGFSAGIDSYAVMADHYYSDVTDGFKVTHLLFNNVGSHGVGGEALFRTRSERLAPHAQALGLPLLVVNSNLSEFYCPEIGFQKTHTLRNTSVVLLLQQGIGRYFYASSFSYVDTSVGISDDISVSDPVLVPMLSTAGLDAVPTGGQYSRVEKTLRIAQVPDSYTALDVCIAPENTSSSANCGKCLKCLRTLNTLEIAGYLDRYESVFDMKNYKRYRSKGFMKILITKKPLSAEVRAYAKEKKFSFPLISHLVALVMRNQK